MRSLTYLTELLYDKKVPSSVLFADLAIEYDELYCERPSYAPADIAFAYDLYYGRSNVHKLLYNNDKLMMYQTIDSIIKSDKLYTEMKVQIINHSLSYVMIVDAYARGYAVLHNNVSYVHKNIRDAVTNGLYVKKLVATAYICDYDIGLCTNIENLDMGGNVYITTCAPFAQSLRVLSAEHCRVSDDGIKMCKYIENLNADGNGCITTCEPFAQSLRILSACWSSCGISDDGLRACNGIRILVAHDNPKITTCKYFAESLCILMAATNVNVGIKKYSGITDGGLRLCAGIERLDADNNTKITTCEPFAASLLILFAASHCGISDDGLRLCTSIEELYANGNIRVTTCVPFAASLRVLFAESDCGIGDDGLRKCGHIEELHASNNGKITTCVPFARALQILWAEVYEELAGAYDELAECGISDGGLRACANIEELRIAGNNKITTCVPFAKSLQTLYVNMSHDAIVHDVTEICTNVVNIVYHR